MVGNSHIEKPTTLKKALEFFSALNTSKELTDKVAENLENKRKKYFNKVNESRECCDIKSCLSSLLVCLHTIRNKIVHRDHHSYFGAYSKLINERYVDYIVITVLGILPRLFGTLYYLYFEVGSNFSGRGGGQWKNHQINNAEEYLCKWLTDSIRHASNDTAVQSKATLLPGGYNVGELSKRRGYPLEEDLATFLDTEDGDAYFPNLLQTLFFDISFSRATTSVVLMFVSAFCSAVAAGTFDSQMQNDATNNGAIKDVCDKLMVNFNCLTFGEGDNKVTLVSQFRGNVTKYKGLLKTDEYANYHNWVKERLPELINILREMQTWCTKWNPNSPYTWQHVGPFVYGYIFGGAWRIGEGDVYDLMPRISKEIAKLIGDCTSETEGTLFALLKCLDLEKYNTLCQLLESQSTIASQQTKGTETLSAGALAKEQTETHQELQLQQTEPVQSTHAASPSPFDLNGRETGPTAVQAPYVASTSSGAEPVAALGDFTQRNDRATPVSDTSSHSSGGQEAAPSGTISSASCSAGESCPGESHDGTSGGPSSSTTRIVNDANVNNTQSTITIGGATGGAAVLGGGCAALYFLNVGGIKTLITGVP
ncbi:secreted antigen 1 [Babesia caballi]|uniref:Secreted antigen 1 n=1 Tax=Babesia caballi TaxID=5871 RepID=A0AAV4M2U3_BABCB|nr:secreted antigen 1 [Babesia caballi]